MKTDIKITFWALISAYAVFNSFIYSWFFWKHFHINILQYASFNDVIPSILYTIALPCSLIIIAVVATQIWNYLKERIEKKIDDILSVHVKGYATLKEAVSIAQSAAIVIVCIIFIYKSYKEDSLPKIDNIHLDEQDIGALTIGIVLMLSLLVSKWVANKTSFLGEVKSHRSWIIFILCIMPAICYGLAFVEANRIQNGLGTYLVKSDSQCTSEPGEKFRYIASISDKAFAMSLRDGSVCVFKYNFLKLTTENYQKYNNALPAHAM